jgi:phosphoadenosine phosphosulfate reductase
MNTIDLAKLNKRFEKAVPEEILSWALDAYTPHVGLSSSFGAESAALLHMATQIFPAIPILFINTGFLFKETIEFKDKLQKRLHLNIREFKADLDDIDRVTKLLASPTNTKGACCDDVKVRLMKEALTGLSCWIAGLRRHQSATRKNIETVELYGEGLLKVHPIARWTSKDIYAYMKKHDLPFHPLWDKGYTSIGCEPCTSLPLPGDDARSGRWAGTDKTECGIHTFMAQNKTDKK